jgi:TRAP-type C4-dicarboxylate transport system substrate-binding protein
MEKKYWIVLAVIVVVLSVLLLPACATTAPSTSTSTPPIAAKTIKLSYTTPKGKGYSGGLEWFGPEFGKRTNGRYKVEIYPASVLYTQRAGMDSLKSRIAEIGVFSTSMFATAFPRFMAMTLPTGVEISTAKDWYSAWDMTWEYYNKQPEVQAECKDFKLLFPIMTAPTYLVLKNKEIHNPTDLKGMKIGASGTAGAIVKGVGGASVQLVPAETYASMEKGVIEGSFLSWAMASDWKIEELAKYYYTMNFGHGFMLVAANLQFWNELTAGDQKILEQTMTAAREAFAKGMIEQEEYGKQAAAKHAKIYAPTKEERQLWEDACKPATQMWIDDATKAGVNDPIRFEKAFRELQHKYFPKQK